MFTPSAPDHLDRGLCKLNDAMEILEVIRQATPSDSNHAEELASLADSLALAADHFDSIERA